MAPLLPDREHAYSPREWDCFRLVDAQLFPLDRAGRLDLDDDPYNRSHARWAARKAILDTLTARSRLSACPPAW